MNLLKRFNLRMGTWMMESRSGDIVFNALPAVLMVVATVIAIVYSVADPSVPLWPYTQQ